MLNFYFNGYLFGFVSSFYNEDEALTNMIAGLLVTESCFVTALKVLLATKVKPEEVHREIELRVLVEDQEGILLIEYDM